MVSQIIPLTHAAQHLYSGLVTLCDMIYGTDVCIFFLCHFEIEACPDATDLDAKVVRLDTECDGVRFGLIDWSRGSLNILK